MKTGKQTNKKKKPKLRNTENRLVVMRGRGWGWAQWVKWVKKYILPYINKSWGYNTQYCAYR